MKQHVENGWKDLSESKKRLVKHEELLRNLESLVESESAAIEAALAAGAKIVD